jgi:hypothetical protein
MVDRGVPSGMYFEQGLTDQQKTHIIQWWGRRLKKRGRILLLKCEPKIAESRIKHRFGQRYLHAEQEGIASWCLKSALPYRVLSTDGFSPAGLIAYAIPVVQELLSEYENETG